MEDFSVGDLTLMEIGLCEFMKDIDINMSAGRQIQTVITKIEMKIEKLNAAHIDQDKTDLDLPPGLNPKA
ncbi:MAG: hypothetical protein KAX15_06815 [Candidatus Omnitrophica bacterium]|nr:hypothetical protein [Candidatus Omnitrophota bacterium]